MGKTPHVVMGTPEGKVCLCCKHCGETFPVPTGAIKWVVGVGEAFRAAHADCKPGCVRVGRQCDLQNIIVEDLIK